MIREPGRPGPGIPQEVGSVSEGMAHGYLIE